MIRKAVVLTEELAPANTSLVVSIVGADRHGIVSALAERAQRFGANWVSAVTKILAERGVSIENMHTEIVRPTGHVHLFKRR